MRVADIKAYDRLFAANITNPCQLGHLRINLYISNAICYTLPTIRKLRLTHFDRIFKQNRSIAGQSPKSSQPQLIPAKDPEETHSRFWVIIRRCHGRFIDAMAITEDMKIADVLKKYPSSRKVFERHIPQCPKCGGAAAESIGRGARQHGIDPEMLVAELNRAARPRKKK